MFDPTETAPHGLLEEMSLVELQARLEQVKLQDKEEEEHQRELIHRAKQERNTMLQKKAQFIGCIRKLAHAQAQVCATLSCVGEPSPGLLQSIFIDNLSVSLSASGSCCSLSDMPCPAASDGQHSILNICIEHFPHTGVHRNARMPQLQRNPGRLDLHVGMVDAS